MLTGGAAPAQERAYELERAAQIKYETLPNLEEQLIEAEAALKSQVRSITTRLYAGHRHPCTCKANPTTTGKQVQLFT